MKTFFTLALLALVSPASAQSNWDLFPLNQKTWWRAGDSLRVYYNDSTEVFGDSRFHRFGEKYIAGVFDDCFLNVWIGISNPDPGEYYPVPREYLWEWESANGIWRIGNVPVFYPLSLPGESWVVPIPDGLGYNQMRVTCTGLDTIDLFGLNTAAKHFVLTPLFAGLLVQNEWTNFQITLTETAGLTRFPPWHLLLEGETGPAYEMVGFEQAGQGFGVSPSWMYFFGHYAPGDIFKWRRINSSIMPGPSEYIWHRDSILAVDFSSEQVVLTSNRQTLRAFSNNNSVFFDSSSTNDPTFVAVYARADFKALWEGAPEWFGPSNAWDPFSRITAWFDTSGQLRIQGQTWFNLNNCNPYPLFDYSASQSLAQTCGLFSFGESFKFSSYGQSLIGCSTNGMIWGDVDRLATVPISEPVTTFTLRLYPTPTDGVLHLRDLPVTGFSGPLSVEIRDAIGRLFFQKSDFSLHEMLDVPMLPAGFYWLFLRSQQALAVGNFVKN